MGSLNIINTGSDTDTSSDSVTDFNPDASNAKERLQNSLFNGAKAVKESVEQGQIEVTDAQKTISENGVMPEVDTSLRGDIEREIDNFSSFSQDSLSWLSGATGQTAAGTADFFAGSTDEYLGRKTQEAGETVNKTVKNVTKTVNETTKGFGNLFEDLKIPALGVLGFAAIAITLYLLKPVLEIGANVSEK